MDGALALAAAMGIGRFAYTALLPGTQRALGVGDGAAGAIASVNLAGYLAGVLAARHLAGAPARAPALRAGLAATALVTVLGAATTAPAPWFALRAAGGVASGLVFVLASAAALERAAPPGKLYGGVGFGIALSGAVAAVTPASAAWNLPWLLLGLAAAALPVPAWRHLAPVATPAPREALPADDPAALGFGLVRLSAAYFLEGLGYIVSGTFAVAAVRRTPGLEPLAPWTWVLTGLAAAPSALLWSAVGRVVGTLTAIYGVGQIIGPLAAGALSQRLGDPRPAVLAAAAAVAAGGLLLAPRARRAA